MKPESRWNAFAMRSILAASISRRNAKKIRIWTAREEQRAPIVDIEASVCSTPASTGADIQKYNIFYIRGMVDIN